MCQSLSSSFKVTMEGDLRRQAQLSWLQYNSRETEAQRVQGFALKVCSELTVGAWDTWQVVLELRREC